MAPSTSASTTKIRGSPRNKSSSSSTRSSRSHDQVIITALGLLIVVYSIVTYATYAKVGKSHNAPPVVSSNDLRSPASWLIQLQYHMFPIHIKEDVETIPHPGYALVTKKDKWPTDLPTTLTVPKFFDESHGPYYFNGDKSKPRLHTVRHFLGNYGAHRLTPEQAAAIGSFHKNRETIYASIASYRDPECRETVLDLFERAEYPDRIRLAILDQRAESDPACIPQECATDTNAHALCQYRDQLDVYFMDARLAVGPVFARHLAHRHYRGEYFAMQIDSHVRFIEKWDSDIIEQWKSANNEMAVLSTYLSDIIGSIDPTTHNNTHKSRPIMCMSDYEGSGPLKHLRHGQQPEGPPGIHGQPTLHPFWAAGFSFARGHFVIQVPYDEYLPMVFQGEEISIGLRGFTYGYDYYAAEKSVCFHMYAVKENEARRKKIPLFWENAHFYQGVGVRAMKRLNTIIGMGKYSKTEWQQDDIVKYGLGQVRKPEKFFRTFGIHVDEKRVEHHLCRFVGKPMMKEFLPALRSDRMGIDYEQIHYEFKDPHPEEPPPPVKHH